MKILKIIKNILVWIILLISIVLFIPPVLLFTIGMYIDNPKKVYTIFETIIGIINEPEKIDNESNLKPEKDDRFYIS